MIPIDSSRLRRRAVALLMTLAFLVLITIAVVGLTVTLRLERTASGSHRDRFVAETLARDAVAEACAKLGTRAGSTNNWVSQPGRILGSGGVRIDTNAGSYLYSTADGTAPAAASTNGAVLNTREWFSGGHSYALTGTRTSTPDPMRVQWIYARRDGTLSFQDPPPYQPANPVIGRFAYWVDDESARLNLNTAAFRSPTNNAGNPANAGLAALPGLGTDTNAVSDLVATRLGNPFRTVADAQRASGTNTPPLSSLTATNRFALTAFNYDPNSRGILLTTRTNLAAGRPFLDILKIPNTDPGTRSALDGSKLSVAVKSVRDQLSRTNWPMLDGAVSFETKYGADRTWQVAARIVDLARCAESTNAIVEPVRYKVSGTTIKNDIADSTVNGTDGEFLSTGRTPLITEMGISYDTSDRSDAYGAPYWRIRYYIEVHLPESYGIDAMDLLAPGTGKRLYVHISSAMGPWGATPSPGYLMPVQFGNIWRNPTDPKGPVGGREWAANAFHRVEAADIVSLDTSGNPVRGGSGGGTTVLAAGKYLTIEKDFWVKVNDVKSGHDIDTTANFKPGNKVFCRAGLSVAGDLGRGSDASPAILPRIAMVPLVSASGANRRWLTLGPPGNVLPNLLASTGAKSLQCDDPRAGTVPGDWQEAYPTFCLPNAVRTVGDNPQSVTPPQDIGANGKISGASLGLPAPKGATGNPSGALSSVAELGRIPTGLANWAADTSIPWRTLRFQPTPGQGASDLPDWAVLDLFAVPFGAYAPTDKLKPYFAPHGAGAGGRVNANAAVMPFGTERLEPLKAVFLDAPDHSGNPSARLSEEEAETAARNILSFTKAQNGVLYGETNVYESAGEIFEIEGVADRGEESEEVARQVAGLITVRGGVFSIFAIGQSLKQTPNGTLHVTAEQRFQTDVERIEEAGAVRFRPVLVRVLH